MLWGCHVWILSGQISFRKAFLSGHGDKSNPWPSEVAKYTYYNMQLPCSRTWQPFLPLRRASYLLWYKEHQSEKKKKKKKLGFTGLPLWREEAVWMCALHYKPCRGSSLALPTLLPTQPPSPHLEAITLPRVPGCSSLPQLRHLAMAFLNHSPTPTVPKLVFSCHSCNCCHIPLQLVLWFQ